MKLVLVLALGVGALLRAAPAQAAVITLGFATVATAVDDSPQDGIFDSFAPLNLGSVNNNGSSSFRTALEFGLSGLAGATIHSATLTVVLSNSEGMRALAVHGYAGDGTVQLSDFALNGLAGIASVGVGSHTLVFDVTSLVANLVANGNAFAGFNVREDPANVPNYLVMFMTLSPTVPALSIDFTFTPRKPLLWGTGTTLTLADDTDERSASIETVAGRSYCAQLAPGAAAVTQATPALAVFRAGGSTALGTTGAAGTCFNAPGTETAVVRVTQTDVSARSYRLRVVETTLWTNWFFVASDYSSFTLLRNTTGASITATLTWRSLTGAVVGTQTVVVPAQGLVASDARTAVTGATAGSAEIGHDGEPQALAGSQTTLSGSTGLSFDTLLVQRDRW